MSCCVAHECQCRCCFENDRRFETLQIYENPPTDSSAWERQYCTWSGWTWVKKSDKEVKRQNSSKNQSASQKPDPTPKKKSFREKICPFFAKNRKSEAQPTPEEAQLVPKETKSELDANSYSDEMECCCCCCPCCHPCCCCNCDVKPQKLTKCCNNETQTVKEVREKATKMSEMEIPKRKPQNGNYTKRRRCRCCRPCCCPCNRNVCSCCCCCSNKEVEAEAKSKSPKSVRTEEPNRDQIVNYCFKTQNSPLDLLKYKTSNYYPFPKTSNFSTLHKSLDILLKNNINILNLFDYKKGLKSDLNPLSAFTSNHTITGLSNDVKPDPEHNKLLTAVCDAILSSHKISEKPHELDSILSNRGVVEKILNDFSFSKSDDSLNSRSSFERSIPRRSFTKLTRTNSRLLNTSKIPKRRLVDLKLNGRRDFRSKGKTNQTNFFKGENQCTTESRFEHLESLMNSLNYSSSGIGIGKHNSSDLNIKNLEDTTPPFGSSDFLLNLESNHGISAKSDKKCTSD